jgi:hypothetical protein
VRKLTDKIGHMCPESAEIDGIRRIPVHLAARAALI